MRTAIYFIFIFLLYGVSAGAATFIFKSGKSVQGEIRFEDEKTIRILESSGLEMTLRKAELNLSATAAANANKTTEALPEEKAQVQLPEVVTSKRPVKVYTNRDIGVSTSPFQPPHPETIESWQKTITNLEREFVRLQGACRGAGTGPNLSKIWRSHTYVVEGKQVKVNGYWADPANIEEAKKICARAIRTEKHLQEARSGYSQYLNSIQNRNAAK